MVRPSGPASPLLPAPRAVGDTIPIHYNNKTYFIDIIEARPEAAISVIETDCNVDFAPPLDYVEPDYSKPQASAAAAASAAEPMDTGARACGPEGCRR